MSYPDPWVGLVPFDPSAPAGQTLPGTGKEPWSHLTPEILPSPKVEPPSGFPMGIQDPFYGTAQLGAHLTGGYPISTVDTGGFGLPPDLPSGSQNVGLMDKIVSDRENQYQEARTMAAMQNSGSDWQQAPVGIDWQRLAGNMVSPMNALIPGAAGSGPIEATLLRGALSGALSGAAQPVTNGGDSFVEPKLAQTGLGAITGTALSPVSRLIGGNPAPEVSMLQNAGVELSPGQAGGQIAKAVEGVGQKIPIVKGLMNSQQERAMNSFNTALINNQILAPLGKELPPGTAAGHDALTAAHGAVTDYYHELMPNLSFSANHAADPADEFMNTVIPIATKVESEQGPGAVSRFYRLVNPFLTNNLSGDALKTADSNLATDASRFRKSPDPFQEDLGDSLKAVRDAVRQQLMRINPESAQQLTLADRAYNMLSTAEAAAKKTPTSGGVFTPAQILSAATQGPFGASNRQFGQGNAPMQPFAEAAQRVIGSNRGLGRSPATASDILMGDVVGGLAAAGGIGAAGAAESGNGPDWLKYGATAALPALMFTRPGAAVLRSGAPGNTLRTGLSNMFQSGGASIPANPAGQKLSIEELNDLIRARLGGYQ